MKMKTGKQKLNMNNEAFYNHTVCRIFIEKRKWKWHMKNENEELKDTMEKCKWKCKMENGKWKKKTKPKIKNELENWNAKWKRNNENGQFKMENVNE